MRSGTVENLHDFKGKLDKIKELKILKKIYAVTLDKCDRIQKPRYSLTEKYFWVILLRDTLVGEIRTNIQCLKEKRGEK